VLPGNAAEFSTAAKAHSAGGVAPNWLRSAALQAFRKSRNSFAVVALRHLFSLPVTHATKWIFEIEESMAPLPGSAPSIASLSGVELRRSASPDFPRLSRLSSKIIGM
jgi:hypothetical protein